MSFQRSEMLYDDGTYYKWSARADHDNPYYTRGTDHTQMNKTEGYEVLYFINHLGAKIGFTSPPSTTTYQKLERIIRYSIPSDIRSHKGKEDWIRQNFNNL